MKLTFRQYASIVIILLILLFHRSVFPLVIAEKNPNAPFQLTVFHMNDVHSRVEQFPLLKTALDEMRHQAKHSLFLHAGDEFTGTLYFSTYHGFSDLDFLNQLQVDAFTIGNHEFDKGPDLLAMFIAKAQFPSLSANIDFTKEQVLDRLFRNKIAQKPKNGKIYPGIIKEFNGEKIGIFGLITEETPTISNPGSNLVFENAVEQGKRIIQQFQRKGVNKIILLSHLGLKQDKKIAEEVEGIDIIVGGHSHTELKKPVVIQKSEPTVIVQATPHLKSLGKLAVTFNQQGKIIDYNGELIYLTEDRFQKNKEFEQNVLHYKAGIKEVMNKQVGATEVDLAGGLAKLRKQETNLGNVIADSMLWKGKLLDEQVRIALINGGSIRSSIPKGTITMGDIRTVLPFENKMVIIELTGAEIIETLEKSVEHYPDSGSGFLQVAGLKFRFNPMKPAGNRVLSVSVMDEHGQFSPLQLERTYKVATLDYLARGGDGHHLLKKAALDGRIKKLQLKDYEVFAEFLKQFKSIHPKVEGRIKVQ